MWLMSRVLRRLPSSGRDYSPLCLPYCLRPFLRPLFFGFKPVQILHLAPLLVQTGRFRFSHHFCKSVCFTHFVMESERKLNRNFANALFHWFFLQNTQDI